MFSQIPLFFAFLYRYCPLIRLIKLIILLILIKCNNLHFFDNALIIQLMFFTYLMDSYIYFVFSFLLFDVVLSFGTIYTLLIYVFTLSVFK